MLLAFIFIDVGNGGGIFMPCVGSGGGTLAIGCDGSGGGIFMPCVGSGGGTPSICCDGSGSGVLAVACCSTGAGAIDVWFLAGKCVLFLDTSLSI